MKTSALKSICLLLLTVLVLITGCKTLPLESGVFRGHFTFAFEKSDFVACGSKEKWWLVGEQLSVAFAVMEASPEKRENPNTVYIEVRGELSATGRFGHLGAYARELKVSQVLNVSAASPDDCK